MSAYRLIYALQGIDGIVDLIKRKNFDEQTNLIKRMIECNDTEILESLLKLGHFDLNRIDQRVCVEECVSRDRISIFKLLVEHRLNFRMGSNKIITTSLSKTITPKTDFALLLACQREKYDIVKYLLELGVDPNVLDGECFVESCGNYDVAKLMIEYGAEVNVQNGCPLIRAILFNNYYIVKLLIEHGANPTLVIVNKVCVPDSTFSFADYLEDAGLDLKLIAESLIKNQTNYNSTNEEMEQVD